MVTENMQLFTFTRGTILIKRMSWAATKQISNF